MTRFAKRYGLTRKSEVLSLDIPKAHSLADNNIRECLTATGISQTHEDHDNKCDSVILSTTASRRLGLCTHFQSGQCRHSHTDACEPRVAPKSSLLVVAAASSMSSLAGALIPPGPQPPPFVEIPVQSYDVEMQLPDLEQQNDVEMEDDLFGNDEDVERTKPTG